MTSLNFAALTGHIADPNTLLLLSISALFIGSFLVFYISNATRIPSFVMALLIGMLFSPVLTPLTANADLLTIIVGVSATLILFSGGLEMPFSRFKKIAVIVLLLSTIGVILSTGLFGLTLAWIAPAFGLNITIGVAILLGAILASTDPTILIPMMKQLRFKLHKMKDLIVGESAATDVTGALLMLLVLEIIRTRGAASNLQNLLTEFFSLQTGFDLIEHALLGLLFGLLGAGLLIALSTMKTQDSSEHDVDAAFFLFVPITIYALATAVGGSGFLAAFIAGLLFQTTEFLHETERFFNHIIDGFIKPSIFILLGAVVPIPILIAYAPVGIAISLIFILLIRPLTVFLTLLPAQVTPYKLRTRELVGLCAIRETGAVPAVLIMSIIGIPGIGTDAFLAIGLWVIIMTVLILPAVTPWIFEKLRIAERIPGQVGAHLQDQREPFVVLASRGGSYKRRLPAVTKWAIQHNIHRVCLLLCLEDKYSKDTLADRLEEAKKKFSDLRKKEAQKGHKIEFFATTTDGYLHDAIRSLPKQSSHAVAVFVGKRMLDFYVEEIQNLGIPLYFID